MQTITLVMPQNLSRTDLVKISKIKIVYPDFGSGLVLRLSGMKQNSLRFVSEAEEKVTVC